MKKLALIMIVIFSIVGCTNGAKQENPYIEFTSDTFYLEWGSDFDPLSSEYIESSNGVITYLGDVDTEIISSVPEHYIFEITYTASNEKNTDMKEVYKIKYIVKERPPFDSKGYAYDFVVYEINNEEFAMSETRFILKEGIQTDEQACENKVCIILDKDKDFSISYGTDGSRNLGGLTILNLWKGEYVSLENNIYHVTDLKEYKLSSDGVTYQPLGNSFEAYFILSSLDKNGKLYYFMEYPENGYSKDMNSFQFQDYQ